MTIKELIEQTYVTCREERDSFIKVKRNGQKYVDVCNLEDFIHDNYVLFLCVKILKIIKKGHDRQSLIQALEITDWIKYSFSGHAYTGLNELSWRLGVKPTKSTNVSDLLFEQGWELEKASKELIMILKEED